MAEAKKEVKKAVKTEEPVTPEENLTAQAVDAAEQDAKVITEKRSVEPTEATAKAGKRSSKALKEAADKQAKEERKASGEATPAKPKQAAKPTRSRVERRGKHFRKSAEQIEKGRLYSLEQAVELAKKTSHVKFDASVELHVNLGVDPRQADQNIRDNLVLPAGTGKTIRVAVADDDLLAKLDKGQIDFDILVATPEFMPKLGKYARVLGPKGLMPNPKSGTVTTDTDKAVAEAKAGRVEYRVDTTGIVHLAVGKVSFTPAQLQENTQAVLSSIKANKPQSIKGTYIKAAYLTTSMGPSIKLDTASIA